LSDTTKLLRDIEEQMRILRQEQATKTNSQMATMQAELSQMTSTNSTLTSKMELLKVELKDAQTRENQLKVKYFDILCHSGIVSPIV